MRINNEILQGYQCFCLIDVVHSVTFTQFISYDHAYLCESYNHLTEEMRTRASIKTIPINASESNDENKFC